MVMIKVAVLGAGGDVGQALSLQLRLSPFVDELALYDRTKAAGVAVDLSHIPAKQVIKGYKSIDDGLAKILTDADIVVITAGPSILSFAAFKTRNDLLESSAVMIGPLIESCAKICPKTIIMIVSNPVNALVPFAAERLRKHNTFDARRLFGVTTLDVVRAETFLAEKLVTVSELEAGMEVNVIGGHSAETMVPLFSLVNVAEKLSSEQVDELTHHTQIGGIEVLLAKDRKGGATSSTAYATFRMVERVCRAMKGEKGMQECTFVYMPGIEGGNEIAESIGLNFFAVPVEFAPHGAGMVINPIKGMSEKEEAMVEQSAKQLLKDIKLGSELGKAFGIDLLKSAPEQC